MPQAEIAQAVQLLDLMLEHFAEDGHWARGRYDDGNGGHCLVGALLHLSRQHHLPRAAAIALLQDAMPRPGLPLVYFNDSCCGSVAELRSGIRTANRRGSCSDRIDDGWLAKTGNPPVPRQIGSSFSKGVICFSLRRVVHLSSDHEHPLEVYPGRGWGPSLRQGLDGAEKQRDC
jgi:hypothetical protein